MVNITVALTLPCIWDIEHELWDLFCLVPHVLDGELRPLRDMHGSDLKRPKDVFLTAENLV